MADNAATTPEQAIRQALQGAMVGSWGRENALRSLNSLMERIRLAEDVAEAADHYTDLIAQAKPVDYGDEAWQMLVNALNAWRPRARQQ